jgi:hypothetical protein
MDVALERAADAKALGNGRPVSVGPVYMAGYAIECSLKAYLHLTKKHVPTSGREGHHLHGLWEAARFRRSDLRNDKAQIFYLERWSTDLRYDAPESLSIKSSSLSKVELLRGAQQLVGWIQTQVRRKGSAR